MTWPELWERFGMDYLYAVDRARVYLNDRYAKTVRDLALCGLVMLCLEHGMTPTMEDIYEIAK